MRHRALTERAGEWNVAVSGKTLEDVFEATARVVANAAGRTADGQPCDWESIGMAAHDVPTLLVDWANELIGRTKASRRAYSELRTVRVTRPEDGSACVSAQLRGKHIAQWTSPLKAATYALSLEKVDHGWHANVPFNV